MTPPATFPAWIFDGSPIEDTFGDGEKAVRFLRGLRHPKSGRPFQLDLWAERIVRRIYGPRHPDGTRIVKTAFIMVPRGNRKTSLGAALTLLHLIGPERLPHSQIVAAAADKKQASIAFDEAAAILRADRRLAPLVDVADYRKLITANNGTKLEAISADGATQHGRTPALVLADELHAWKNGALWEALKTALPKTPGSLLVVITTAGRGQENVAFTQYQHARKVALGEIDDPATLPVLFEAPVDADWRDEELWHLVNPGLAHGYPDLAGLRQLAREAESRPADRESFRQLHLNVWLDHSADPFVEMAIYDAGAAPIDLEALEGKPCWLGVDMSTTTDLTAVVAAFRTDDDGYIVLPTFFCPGDNLRGRADRDGVPYPQWAADGHLVATPGNVVDYRAVEAHIRQLAERFDVREVAFDKAYAMPVMAPLMDDGFPVLTMQLGWVTQSPALNELERAIVAGKFQHGAHPVLRWCFSNVAIHTDPAGNRTMHKGKSTDRIDGAFATWMAVSRAAASEHHSFIYDDAAARPDGILWLA